MLGLSGAFLFPRTPNETPMISEVLTVATKKVKKNTLTLLLGSCYHCVSQYERTIHLPVINSGVFLFSPEGFYSGRSPGVGFGLPQLLPSERCFLCWYPAMNPIFLLRLLMVDLWMLTKSMDQEELYGDLDVEILFLSSRRAIFILCTCILAESDVSLEDSPHLRVFPHVECVAGKNSVASWSFWKELGRISRLTGVNVNTLGMWPDRIRSLHATARWHMCLLRVRDHLML